MMMVKLLMMNIRLLIGIFWFFIGHIAVFLQLNSQFKWDWAKENSLILAIFGVPISFCYIWATRYTIDGLGGVFWPARFIGFGIGMIIYAIGVSVLFNQGMTPKTVISLILATLLICIQVLWK